MKRLTQATDITQKTIQQQQLPNTIPGLPSRQGSRQASRQGSRQGSRQASSDSLRKIENDFVRNSVSRGGQRLSGDEAMGGLERPSTRAKASREGNRMNQVLEVNEDHEELVRINKTGSIKSVLGS